MSAGKQPLFDAFGVWTDKVVSCWQTRAECLDAVGLASRDVFFLFLLWFSFLFAFSRLFLSLFLQTKSSPITRILLTVVDCTVKCFENAALPLLRLSRNLGGLVHSW